VGNKVTFLSNYSNQTHHQESIVQLDLKADRAVTREEGEALAKEIKALYFEVSAKDESETDLRALFMQTSLFITSIEHVKIRL